jgi:hypothetical protein
MRGLLARLRGEFYAIRYGVWVWWWARPYRLSKVCGRTWMPDWDARHQNCQVCAMGDYEEVDEGPWEFRLPEILPWKK